MTRSQSLFIDRQGAAQRVFGFAVIAASDVVGAERGESARVFRMLWPERPLANLNHAQVERLGLVELLLVVENAGQILDHRRELGVRFFGVVGELNSAPEGGLGFAQPA